jgi:hypothetical protein
VRLVGVRPEEVRRHHAFLLLVRVSACRPHSFLL